MSLPEELQPAVLEPALVVDWLARYLDGMGRFIIYLLWVNLGKSKKPSPNVETLVKGTAHESELLLWIAGIPHKGSIEA